MNRTSRLGAALLLLVAAVHYGYAPLADWFYPEVKNAPKAIFYIFRGFEGAILWSVIYVFAPRSWPLTTACVWGAIESFQTGACRLAIGINHSVKPSNAYSGLCDVATDFPLVAITAAGVIVVMGILQEAKND